MDMKALVYTGPQQMAYRDEPMPTPKSGEVLVEICAVGICGSDLHAYLGHDDRRPAPLILGHEGAGIVRSGEMDGQAVVINPLVSCGECDHCLTGYANQCGKREIISMPPREGAFAEFVAVPTRNLVPVPDGMSLTKASLAEPIATGWHAVTKGAQLSKRPLVECKTLVYGGGAVGLAAALSLHAQGCKQIYLAETNALRRDTVNSANVCTVLDPLTDDAITANSIDLVVDCVGNKHTRMGASAAVKPGGVIIHVGLQDSVEGLDVRKFTLQEVTFAGSYTYTMQDFKATLEAMHNGALGALDWIQERPLNEGADAFEDLLNGRIAAAKVVLRPEE
ncbi:alcohol dehydrogenase catalytic domain-containing protein [Enterovibrio sp. ZSDZ35]|uniref:Alcohol dehydrogenase catalytic domain-containing protein n=1 Tax=Enterovibrio qingdaonensis TaxID=2899818 RepID=A0ABT5QG67_9GAMM|nr:alcohol dehydrogenase catalytic domain-containing protein [Enterovibrio sp. ZSDZ35]MDD1779960.1 alcohol dehydrogenase catalytic domain-containing protein [Enterovibrio sp. ZSDZ35]